MNATDIVGYTYDAENLCPECTIDSMVMDRTPFPSKPEEILDFLAEAGLNPRREIINRQDENTFDSNTFPKVIFYSSDLVDEQCGHCGEKLT